MPKRKTAEEALRTRKARDDAAVSTITATVEKMMGLPRGSVALVVPSGRKKRGDATVASLRRSWDK